MNTSLATALRLLSLVVLVTVAASCGRQDPTTLEPEEGYPDPFVDARPLVADVRNITLDPTPGGAILRATGITATQGWWDIGMRRDRAEDETPADRTYALRGRPPVDATGDAVAAPVGPVALREVEAAVFLSDSDLEGLRRITVRGATTSRSLRR